MKPITLALILVYAMAFAVLALDLLVWRPG